MYPSILILILIRLGYCGIASTGAADIADEPYGFDDEDTADNTGELVLGLIDLIKANGIFNKAHVAGYSKGGNVARIVFIEDARQLFARCQCGSSSTAAPPPAPDVVRYGILRCVDPDKDGALTA